MEEKEKLNLGVSPVIGIFGDSKLQKLKESKNRSFFLRGLKSFLLDVSPSEILIMPEQGTSTEILSAFRVLDIPFSLIMPFTGYCDTVDCVSKLHLKLAVSEAKSVIVVGDPPKNIRERHKSVKEAEDFIIQRADVLMSIFGEKSKTLIERRTKKFLKVDKKPVVFMNYDLIE